MQMSQDQINQLSALLSSLLVPQSLVDGLVGFFNGILSSIPNGGGFTQEQVDAARVEGHDQGILDGQASLKAQLAPQIDSVVDQAKASLHQDLGA